MAKRKIVIDVTSKDFNKEECLAKLASGEYQIDDDDNPYYEEEEQEQEQETQSEESKQPQEQEEKPKEKADFNTNIYIKPKNYNLVLTAIKKGLNPLLIGSSGTGKTRMCAEIAKELNLPFYSESAVNDEYIITGFMDANGKYIESNFYKAFTEGGLFLFDELDASDANACIKFNAAIANGYCIFPCGMKEAHPNFRVVATANTFGNGADLQYVGRNQLDGATLDRFKPQIVCDYEPKIEEKLTNDEKLLEFVRNFRKSCLKNSIQKIVSYRTIIAMDRLKDEKVFSNKELVRSCLTIGLDKSDLTNIRDSMDVLNDNRYMEGFEDILKQK